MCVACCWSKNSSTSLYKSFVGTSKWRTSNRKEKYLSFLEEILRMSSYSQHVTGELTVLSSFEAGFERQ